MKWLNSENKNPKKDLHRHPIITEGSNELGWYVKSRDMWLNENGDSFGPVLWLDETEDDQEELFQSAKEIIEDNLQNIRTAEQTPLLSTDKCEEIAGFIIHDLKEQFIITRK